MMHNRIVTLVDMDCFYCQVEARLNPELKGKPMAVVQYNAWKGGGIIAVNYEARDKGVTRHMRGDDAKNQCPDIELVKVPSVRGKADLTKYRDAGREVINVICEFSDCVQRASIDEAYIDLTDTVNKRLQNGQEVGPENLANTFIVGYTSQGKNDEGDRSEGIKAWLSEIYDDEFHDEDSKRLAVGALIVEEMRAAIFNKTGFNCSAGIAHNKILAKLVCGLHKPNRQTVLPSSGISNLFNDLPVQKVRNLGGKFGNDVIERLGCKVMADITKYSEKELQSNFDEKTGTWLYNIARGIDLDPVTPRLVSKSIGCCKQFRGGKAALKTKDDVIHWIRELAVEINERLEDDLHMNKRKAQQLTVSVQQMISGRKTPTSKTVSLPSYDAEVISDVAFSALKRTNTAPQSSDAWIPPLNFLGISVGKFVDDSVTSSKPINQYFQNNSLTTTQKYEVERNCKSEKSINEKSGPNLESETVAKKQSFFERYFQSKTNENKASVNTTDLENESVNAGKDSKPSCSYETLNKQNFIQCYSRDTETDSNNESNDSTLENKKMPALQSSNGINNNDEHSDDMDVSWISPSEIFPDLNNIDENVMSLLPLPLQQKIMARSAENIVHLADNKKTVVDSSDTLSSEEIALSSNIDNSVSATEYCEIVMSSEVHDSSVKPSASLLNDNNSNKSSFPYNNSSSKCETESIENLDCDIFLQENKSQIPGPSKAYDVIYDSPNAIEIYKLSACNSKNISQHSSAEGSELCHYCNENISIIEFQEHVDHHLAVELHEKLNSYQPETVSSTVKRNELPGALSKSIKSKSPHKRKKPGSKRSTHIEAKKSRSILSFFTPK